MLKIIIKLQQKLLQGRFYFLIFLFLSTTALIPIALRSDAAHDSFAKPVSGPALDYGVFPGYTGNLDELSQYKMVVVDAQYISRQDIVSFKKSGHSVYSYLNIGSLETFRPYYSIFSDLTTGNYEGWDNEKWIDVSSARWQDYVLNTLTEDLLKKDIDGFFIDNCDVYYHDNGNKVFDGLTYMLKGIAAKGLPVIINGGDTFMNEYLKTGNNPLELAYAINQESVLSSSDPDAESYFRNYVEKFSTLGFKIYLMEYTSDEKLCDKIVRYCASHDFTCYIEKNK